MVMSSPLPYPLSFFSFYLLYRFVNVYCFFLVSILGLHAWRLKFHGGKSMKKVMDSPLPYPPSLFFYFSLFYIIFYVYCFFLVVGLDFHACKLRFHRGISLRNVLASSFPSSPSYLF